MTVDYSKVGIDWGSFYSQDEMELRFLGQVYRALHSRGDRGNIATPKRDIDPVTGYAKSEASQLSHAKARKSYDLVLGTIRRPHKQALAELISDDPEVEDCEGCGRAHAGIHMEWKTPECIDPGCVIGRDVSGGEIRQCKNRRHAWTEAEAAVVARVEYLWKRCFEVMANKGWVRLERSVEYETGDAYWDAKYKNPLGRDRLPKVARVTPLGLDEAEKRIPGTAYARGPFSYLSTAPSEKKAYALKAVPWAMKAVKNEEQAGI